MPKVKELIRVRLAPSPTGRLHIGTARIALVNWLFARQHNGTFVLRIEDTDKERSKKEYEEDLFLGLRWLGLEWDEGPALATNDKKRSAVESTCGPYRQSERTEIYEKYLNRLLDEGKAYYCYCTKEDLEAEKQAMLAQGLPPKYGGHCRNINQQPAGKEPQVIRFKTPEGKIEFKDLIRGNMAFDGSLFGDIVIAKDLKTSLYNFAATVDDEEMHISHVIRGEDHLSNTPKQILIQKALGFKEPEYGHLPLILNPDRSKMSKRFADTALSEYISRGYLPEAIVNFLALLGWHPKDEREIFSLKDLVKEFDFKRIQKAGAVFNQDKLDWLQKEYMKNLSTEEITDQLMEILKNKNVSTDKDFLKKIIEIERPRLTTLNEFYSVAGFFFRLPEYDAKLLVWRETENIEKIKNILNLSTAIIKSSKNIDRATLAASFAELINKEGRGSVLWPLRVALSGQAASPDPLEIIEALGKEESERRIKMAITKLEGNLL
ncbi:MAG: glutamate--tRNA ligase [Patescibacteria group bacterium]|nr:glutamate--tRNA ligase [Patescibacteria group bacterium]MDE2015716.1 glutamate--tRNA ligase [Patescibacteria group bacterium]MDE2226774.1 glutamate--tRNA ligase [Patescibacteria group bacterium]